MNFFILIGSIIVKPIADFILKQNLIEKVFKIDDLVKMSKK